MAERQIKELYDLHDEVAVVTGGGRGIGKGIAMAFFEAGAKVVVAARRTHEIEAVAEEIRKSGGEALAVTTDVTSDKDMVRLAKLTLEHFGKISIWVNNAGGSPMRMPLKELPRDEWDRTIALNLTSIYVGTVTAAQYMEKGSVINITSGAGTGPVPGSAHYGAAKAGGINLTKSLAVCWGPHNINVNCIAPGLTATEGVSQWLPNKNQEDGTPVPPLEYPPDPEHVAELATFLASRSSSHISGELFPIRALTELA